MVGAGTIHGSFWLLLHHPQRAASPSLGSSSQERKEARSRTGTPPPLWDSICRLNLVILLPFHCQDWFHGLTWLQRRLGNAVFILEGRLSRWKWATVLLRKREEDRKEQPGLHTACWAVLVFFTISGSPSLPRHLEAYACWPLAEDRAVTPVLTKRPVTPESKHIRGTYCSALPTLCLWLGRCGRKRWPKAKHLWMGLSTIRSRQLSWRPLSCRELCLTEKYPVHVKPPRSGSACTEE